MKHKKPIFEIYTYGEYEKWDKNDKNIPRIKEITNEIIAHPGTEFGYILHIKKGKGEKLAFEIRHPSFYDKRGNEVPAFTGEHYIRTNNYQFYLGDCIWEPVEDKLGRWELLTFHNNKQVAQKIFTLK